MTALDGTPIESGSNTAGALIFFGYIVAALILTGLIVIDNLGASPQEHDVSMRESRESSGAVSFKKEEVKSTKRSKQKRRHSGWIYFPVVASVSFAVLSWNMLMFLVDSYLAWTTRHNLPAVYALYNPDGITTQLQQIWSWATHSTLFKTFAEHLLLTEVTWQRTRVVLLYSYALNLWMSLSGHGRGVPNLWRYFMIDQILPVSFGQNLFCTALYATPKCPTGHLHLGPAPVVRVGSVLCYIGLLHVVPYAIDQTAFLPVILLLRLLLFTPFLIDRYTFRAEPVKQHSKLNARNVTLFSACLLVLWGVMDTVFRLEPRFKERNTTGSNYAYSALAQDMWLGAISLIMGYALGMFGILEMSRMT